MVTKNIKLKICLTSVLFTILNYVSIKRILDGSIHNEGNGPIILKIGFPFEWFRLYWHGGYYINLFQLLLHIIFCYLLTLLILKIIKYYNYN